MTKTSIISRSDDWDKKASIAINWYFLANAANATVKIVLPIPESMWGIVSALFGASILLMFFYCIRGLFARNSRLLTQSYVVFILVYSISIILSLFRGDPINLIITGSAFWTLVWWIPIGVLACSIQNYRILYDVSLRFSYIICACALAMFVFHPVDTAHQDYNMSFGNIIIIPLLFHINDFFKKRNLLVLAVILVEIAVILIYANRGVLAALVFFFFYKSLFGVSKKYRTLMVILLVVFVTAAIVIGSTLLRDFFNVLDSYGYSSRTLTMMLSGGMSYSSGRDEIWAECFKMIGEKPILGWGLGGEFYHLAAADGVSEANSTFHPHNSLIQCLVDFGVFFGTVIGFLMIKPFFRLGKIKDEDKKNLILIFGSAVVVPCCISACGFFILPAVAIYFYLFYFSKNHKIV